MTRALAIFTCVALASPNAHAQNVDSSASAPVEPSAPDASAQAPAEKPKYTRWQEAATSSGIVSFVGLVIGAVAVPGAIGLVALAAGVTVPTDVTYGGIVAGGAIGAGIGGAIGAVPTTEWYGWPLVGASGAVGSLVGLVPAFLIGHFSADDPDLAASLAPAQSAAIVAAIAGAAGGAALAGAFFALPDEGPEKITGHTVTHEIAAPSSEPAPAPPG